jgi:mycofactocin precursor
MMAVTEDLRLAGEHSMSDEPTPTGESPATEPAIEPAIEQDLLVEDVSIDGMCGVY